LRRPTINRRPNIDPFEGRGCCCAPSRSQQRRSWSSPRRRRHPDQAATLLPPGQHRRSLRALSPLWLPYPPRQFLQDSCPGRLPRLRHARPRLCHLPSQTARHPIHGRPHRLPTSGGRWEPEPRGHVGTSRAALRREAGAGAQVTCGAPRAALSREVGAGAAGTCDALGAALRREAGVGAQATRGAPGAALCQEVGVGTAGTRGAPGLRGGSRNRGDTWRPRSYPAPGGK
jgi:hypothetical protein